MLEILNKYGYKPAGSCNCNGVFTLKYKNGDYLLKWRKSRYKFMVFEKGLSITSWLEVKELETKLNEIHQLTPA